MFEYLVNMADEFGNINESTLYHGFLSSHVKTSRIDFEHEPLISLGEMEQNAIAQSITLYGNNTKGNWRVTFPLEETVLSPYLK